MVKNKNTEFLEHLIKLKRDQEVNNKYLFGQRISLVIGSDENRLNIIWESQNQQYVVHTGKHGEGPIKYFPYKTTGITVWCELIKSYTDYILTIAYVIYQEKVDNCHKLLTGICAFDKVKETLLKSKLDKSLCLGNESISFYCWREKDGLKYSETEFAKTFKELTDSELTKILTKISYYDVLQGLNDFK